MLDEALKTELSEVPLFSRLSDEQLEWLAERGEDVTLEAGEQILVQDGPVEHFWVVLEGETRFTVESDGRESPFISHTSGVFFAEVPILLGTPSLATGYAVKRSRFFRLGADDFWLMLRTMPATTREIVVAAAGRINLRQGVVQQQAKLVSLGTMAAGLAHELNNPAAAIGRNAKEAREALRESSAQAVELGGQEMDPAEREFVAGLPKEAASKAETAPRLDSLEQSDREDEIALWLEDHGLEEEAWDLSPTFAGSGLDTDWLDEVAKRVADADALSGVLAWLAAELRGDELLREVESGSARISELVGAVKSYSHMDRSPVSTEVDVREGLDSTLVMLGHKLKKGDVSVTRDYDEDLPRICARPGELNQVWTNLIDNAIDAVDGSGNVAVRAVQENDRVLVEVSDDGPGIPEDVKNRIFEPFFTTKEIGAGTGLGLDISRRIVVGAHKGDIRVLSEPGETRFQVRLPINAATDGRGEA